MRFIGRYMLVLCALVAYGMLAVVVFVADAVKDYLADFIKRRGKPAPEDDGWDDDPGEERRRC